jgi:hypothetical protein
MEVENCRVFLPIPCLRRQSLLFDDRESATGHLDYESIDSRVKSLRAKEEE